MRIAYHSCCLLRVDVKESCATGTRAGGRGGGKEIDCNSVGDLASPYGNSNCQHSIQWGWSI